MKYLCKITDHPRLEEIRKEISDEVDHINGLILKLVKEIEKLRQAGESIGKGYWPKTIDELIRLKLLPKSYKSDEAKNTSVKFEPAENAFYLYTLDEAVDEVAAEMAQKLLDDVKSRKNLQ